MPIEVEEQDTAVCLCSFRQPSLSSFIRGILMKISKNCLLAAGLSFVALAAQAQVKGPDPTNASIQAAGPFAVASQTVARGSGFGGGTIFVPTAPGTYALVAFCPGFTATRSSISTLSQRLATHGFVVIAMDTNSTLDFPPSRGTQLQAALNRVIGLNTGAVAGKVDPARLVVAGWSMGGGGTLYASRTNPAIKAATPFAGFSFDKAFNSTVPTVLAGGSADTVAPDNQHSVAFFNQLPDATPKLFAEVAGASHQFPTTATPNQPTSKFQIAWVKRFADNDARYEQFITAAAVQAEVASGRLSRTLRESTPF
jgi:triacylglycerol lipase